MQEQQQTGESLTVLLETRSSLSMIRTGKYCVRHFETLALAGLLGRLESWHFTAEDSADAILLMLEQMQTSLTRLAEAEAALLPTQPRRRTGATRLRFHPANWQAELVAGAPPGLRTGLLILALTGCRPCELARGIEFMIGAPASDVRLTLDVLGAKCDQHRGQPIRTFQFLAEDVRPAVTELIGALHAFQLRTSTAIFRFAKVSNQIRERARKLWPGHQALPSAYSFRYAFRQHMALLGATRAEIARAMGHRSVLSSLSYGHQMSRQRTQDLAIDISASFEPHYPDSHRDYAERWHDERAARLIARDRALDLHADLGG